MSISIYVPAPKLDVDSLLEAEVARTQRVSETQQYEFTQYPPSLSGWVEDVYEAHKDLIERWEGFWWHGTKGYLSDYVSVEDVAQVRDKVLTRMGLPFSDLTISPVEPAFTSKYVRESGTLRVGVRRPHYEFLRVTLREGQAISRGVLREIRKLGTDIDVQFWESFLEQMGQAWTAMRDPLYLTLSCAPSTFLRLGHLGENNSCYQAGGMWEVSKTNLGYIPNSVVGLTYTDPPPEDLDGTRPRVGSVKGRFWGILDPEEGGGILTNLYNGYWEQIAPHMGEIMADSLDIPDREFSWGTYDVFPRLEDALSRYAYVNSDSIVIHPKEGDYREVMDKVLNWDYNTITLLLAYKTCENCDEHGLDEDMHTCEECRRVHCSDCFERELRCCTREDSICADCLPGCDHCLEVTCSYCASYCDGCGDRVCEICYDQSCYECGTSLCRGCVVECSGTQRNWCSRAMCGICETCEECQEEDAKENEDE